MQGWLHKKDKVEQSMKQYWPIRHELAMINDIAMTGKRIILHVQLQIEILEQMHSNHMGIEKMKTFFLLESQCIG